MLRSIVVISIKVFVGAFVYLVLFLLALFGTFSLLTAVKMQTGVTLLPGDFWLAAWLAIIFGFPYAATRWILATVGRSRVAFDPDHCTSCGYNLTGNLSGVCPECGTPIPPAAIGTTDDGTVVGS